MVLVDELLMAVLVAGYRAGSLGELESTEPGGFDIRYPPSEVVELAYGDLQAIRERLSVAREDLANSRAADPDAEDDHGADRWEPVDTRVDRERYR